MVGETCVFGQENFEDHHFSEEYRRKREIEDWEDEDSEIEDSWNDSNKKTRIYDKNWLKNFYNWKIISNTKNFDYIPQYLEYQNIPNKKDIVKKRVERVKKEALQRNKRKSNYFQNIENNFYENEEIHKDRRNRNNKLMQWESESEISKNIKDIPNNPWVSDILASKNDIYNNFKDRKKREKFYNTADRTTKQRHTQAKKISKIWISDILTSKNNTSSNLKNRKKRSLEKFYNNADRTTRNRITEAKQWISETYASFAIPTTDKFNQICLKKSQFINSLKSFIPKTILQYCHINYLDINDDRFTIEKSQGDLVAKNDVCITQNMWKIIISISLHCKSVNILDTEHRLKIIYHHEEFNDTDISKRIRRELRNQSPFFEQALYMASVLEECDPGLVVTTVKARDPENSPVTYQMTSLLDSRSQGMFDIDSKSGTVSIMFLILGNLCVKSDY